MVIKRFPWLGAGVLAVVVLLIYTPALGLNFYADDYSFLEKAGRSSLPEYLAFYFDPGQQTGWYRPLQGMYFGIEYLVFGGNPLGYHVFNVLVHLVNCLLLWAILLRVLKNSRVAVTAALIYAGLPLYSVAVFWPGDADFFLALFYLSCILCWVVYLQEKRRFFYVAALGCFGLALLTKEFGTTLPLLLWLADRLLLGGITTPAELVRRYGPFVAAWVIYLPLEYSIQQHSVLTNMFGYGIGPHSFLNLVGYLVMLAFPWDLPEPVRYMIAAAAGMGCLGALILKRSAPLLFLCIASILAFLPVINFPWFVTRYLYLSVMGFAVALAVLLGWAGKRIGYRIAWRLLVPLALGLVVLGNGLGTASAADDFRELIRQTRVPFRDITQKHPSLPEDTYFYFVDAPSPISEYSGMFFLRYGPGVHVSGNTARDGRARLGKHKNAILIFFDGQKRTQEIPVDDSARFVETPTDYSEPIRLAGYEMPSTRARRGGAFALVLYWQAMGLVDHDYAVSLQIVDPTTGNVVINYDQELVRQAHLTLSASTNEPSIDNRILPVPQAILSGRDYELHVTLRDTATDRIIPVRNPQPQSPDKIVIGPLVIE